MNQYEAMFLLDPTFGASFDDCETEIRRLMERADGELVFCKKWDERRLAYKVKGRKRGVYVLTYFNGHPERIGGIERDVKISENVLRVLILRADGVTQDMMERAVASHGAEDEEGYGDDRPRSPRPAAAAPAEARPAPAPEPAPAATAVAEPEAAGAEPSGDAPSGE